ncbi:MAG: ROK family protein [Actinomycetota bacterium]|nr:ROK family protein [Actinomycetota bacterium]
MKVLFGVDVGGSGIKGAPVDLEDGELTRKRRRIPTPQPATPEAVYGTIAQVIDEREWDGDIGVAIPAVVVRGVAKTAANIDASWIGTNVRRDLERLLDRTVTVLNDADAAALAEMSYGAGRGFDGVVVMLTFGTGVGSGLFVDGTLVPNVELGHMEFEGQIAEATTAARLVEEDGLSIEEWGPRVDRLLERVYRMFSPQVIIVGGGISKRFGDFSKYLSVDCDVVPAALRNDAGIVGAAVAAATAAI